MRIASFQFAAGPDITANLAALERGIGQAAAQGVELLLTQECALTGYPPVELPLMASLDPHKLAAAKSRIRQLARLHGMHVALGSANPGKPKGSNVIELFAPDGIDAEPYQKRALWGWDSDNFAPGRDQGIYTINGVRIGIRVCFEIRFPEYFRELFAAGVELALVSFCDVAAKADPHRLAIIQGHLVTRAVENAMTIISANSVSGCQTAPVCVIDPDGRIVQQSKPDQEDLMVFDYQRTGSSFGRDGRISHSRQLLGMELRP